ncbi:MAG: hypothetical protein CL569_02345 [Alphaproteobacteria bacterium]|nr:hypothetical protein [Alphaproteobacteria bacterium]
MPTLFAVVLLPDDDGTVGAVEVTSDRGSTVISDSGAIANIAHPTAAVAAIPEDEFARHFDRARVAHPPKPISFVLYFKSDSDELTDESEVALVNVLATIEGWPAPRIAVVGHTDRVGDDAEPCGPRQDFRTGTVW